MTKILFLGFFVFSMSSLSKGGWLIVNQTTGDNIEIPVESTLYIQNNIIKSLEGEYATIFDLNKWKLTFISQAHSGYWMGTPSEYIKLMRKSALDYLEKEIGVAEEDEKAGLKNLYENIKLDIQHGSDAVSFFGELPVEIIMSDESDWLLGYQVNLFLVYIDGVQIEEIWMTREISPSDEYEFEKFRNFVDEMSFGNIYQDYHSSEQYIHLMKSGLPLKTLQKEDSGAISTTEVVKVERRKIPETDFSPPVNFKLMNLHDLGLWF